VLTPQMLFGEIMEQITSAPSPIVVISAVPPFAVRHARHLAKRLRHRLDETKILAAVWGDRPLGQSSDSRLRAAGVDRVVSQLSQVAEHVERLLKSRQPNAPASDEAPAEAMGGPKG
jgi:hypothetical protein